MATYKAILIALLLFPLIFLSPAEAGILSTLAKAGKAAKVTGVVGAGLLADSLGFIKRLQTDGSIRRLAVGTDDSGHLRIAAANGDEWVITTPDELAMAIRQSDRTAMGSLTARSNKPTQIFVPDTELYRHSKLFAWLPSHVELRLIHRNKQHYRVTNSNDTGAAQWNIQVREHVQINLPSPEMLDEMLFRLERTINNNAIRLLRLQPEHEESLPTLARSSGYKMPAVDAINPAQLNQQLRSIRGQTAIISGRIESGVLIADAGKAGISHTPLKKLREAATRAGVNLIIMDTTSPVQAGTKGLFGKQAHFPDLQQALQRNTYADFLDALAPAQSPIILTAQREGTRYIALSSSPRKTPQQSDALLLTEVPSLVLHAIHIVARDQAETEEHDRRIVSWIPSWVLITLLGNAVLGIMSWSTAWSHWWRKIWKPALRETHSNALTWYLMRSIRILVFFVLFLPVVGGPAFLYDIFMTVFRIFIAILRSFIWILKLPVRLVLWVNRIKS